MLEPIIDAMQRRIAALEAVYLRGAAPPVVKFWLDTETWPLATHTPTYAYEGDSCADLYSAQTVYLQPGERVLIHTGLHIALPAGYECQVRCRSGLALKQGFTIVNAIGTIDRGYVGEICVIALNTDARNSIQIDAGDRIAQLAFVPIQQAIFERVETQEALGENVRGTRGFGSTGV